MSSRRPIKVETLKKRADFLALRSGDKTGAPGFLMVKRPRGDGGDLVRIGLTVTKKLGGAVARNRIKRRLRAAAREVFPELAEEGCDYVLIARAPAATREFARLLDDMKRALLRLSPTPK